MAPPTRRRFLATAAGLSASLLAASKLRAAGANERVRVAILGAGNQGRRHAESLLSLPNAEIAAVSDVDADRLAAQHALVGKNAQAVADFRRILDDPSIDAVTIALPDHWHAPAALLAIAAGKHVYVEKPCSHNVREGRKLVDAASKSKLVVAHGTQSRATPGIIEAIALLRDGAIGKVLIAKCWNYQLRDDIGRSTPSSPPTTVDYDAWVGPAEWMPFQENRFHYNWHWWRNFGTGDGGNDGCHELDLALWGLGVDQHPSAIAAVGGKYHFKDDQEFPIRCRRRSNGPATAPRATAGCSFTSNASGPPTIRIMSTAASNFSATPAGCSLASAASSNSMARGMLAATGS
jgi:predicted dehydrogenase